MRIAVAGVVSALVVFVALSLAALPNVGLAQRNSPLVQGGSAGLTTLSSPIGENRQQLTVVDPDMRVISVYHIDAKGEITLKSVRNIHWDLQMVDFNSSSPLPREIRALLEQK